VPICDASAIPDICNSADETYVVVTIVPPNDTVEFFTKPLPVSVKPKAPVDIEAGATAFKTGIGFCSVTVLLLAFVASAALVAVIVIVFGVGKLIGAAYIPFASIVPVDASPPATEFTDQFTTLLVVPLTVAAKASVEPARIVAVAGVTVTLTLPSSGFVGDGLELDVFEPRPEQPPNINNRIAASALQMRFTDMTSIVTSTNRHFPIGRQHGKCCHSYS
jgi:hypothetical protein